MAAISSGLTGLGSAGGSSAAPTASSSSSMSAAALTITSLAWITRSSSRNWVTNGMLTELATGNSCSAPTTCLSCWTARVPAATPP